MPSLFTSPWYALSIPVVMLTFPFQADYDDPVTEQPRTTEMLTGSLGGVVGVSGVSAHSSEYGSVEGSEKGSKRYYRLETSEGVPTEIKKT